MTNMKNLFESYRMMVESTDVNGLLSGSGVSVDSNGVSPDRSHGDVVVKHLESKGFKHVGGNKASNVDELYHPDHGAVSIMRQYNGTVVTKQHPSSLGFGHGYFSGSRGAKGQTSPYPEGSKEHKEYVRGFEEGEEDRREDKRERYGRDDHRESYGRESDEDR